MGSKNGYADRSKNMSFYLEIEVFMSIFKQKSASFTYNEGRAFERGKAEGADTNWESLVFTSGKIPAIVPEGRLIAALGGKAENLDLMRQRTEPSQVKSPHPGRRLDSNPRPTPKPALWRATTIKTEYTSMD